MISDLAIMISMNMFTCCLMFELWITHPTHFVGDWLRGAITLLIFAAAALMLGYYGAEWVLANHWG